MIDEVKEPRLWLAGVRLNVPDEELRRARIGFSFNILRERYQSRENSFVSEGLDDADIPERTKENMREHLNVPYSLRVFTPPELAGICTSALPIYFTESVEALETAMRKSVDRLNAEGYVNVHYISPLEAQAITAQVE